MKNCSRKILQKAMQNKSRRRKIYILNINVRCTIRRGNNSKSVFHKKKEREIVKESR